MSAHGSTERVEKLPGSRLAPAGPRAAGGAVWAARGAFSALAIAAAWWAGAWVRPLPRAGVEAPGAVPASPSLRDASPSLAEREKWLGALTASNAFALDRAFWPVERAVASAEGGAEAIDAGDAPAPVSTVEQSIARGAADARRDPWKAPVTDPASVRGDMLARIKEVDFKGVYRMGDEPVALIGLTKDRPRLTSMRAGDTFDDGAWRVEAIDDVRDRVLISRDGKNFEFRLYDGAVARATDETAAKGSAAGDGVEAAPIAAAASAAAAQPLVARRSVEDVRRDLAAAGVADAEIAELLELATAEGDASAEGDAVAQAAGGADAPEAPAVESAPPAGIGAVLQLLKSNPVGGGEERASERPSRKRRRDRDDDERRPRG